MEQWAREMELETNGGRNHRDWHYTWNPRRLPQTKNDAELAAARVRTDGPSGTNFPHRAELLRLRLESHA